MHPLLVSDVTVRCAPNVACPGAIRKGRCRPADEAFKARQLAEAIAETEQKKEEGGDNKRTEETRSIAHNVYGWGR